MAVFDRAKFTNALADSAEFTIAQVNALAEALEASLEGVVMSGESRDALPLRGVAAELS